MKKNLFSNKMGLISFLVYVIFGFFAGAFDDITIGFILVMLIATVAGLFFALWVVVRLISYFKKGSWNYE